MIFAFLSPETARIAIPVALAVAYACYHLWRWRRRHPKKKIVIADSPKLTGEPVPVKRVEPSDKQEQPKEAQERPQEHDEQSGKHVEEAAESVENPFRDSRWADRYEQEMAAAQFDFEAVDPGLIAHIFEKAHSGKPEYFGRLGAYAWHRGAMVEAHFWLTLAACQGVEGLGDWMEHIRRIWVRAGCPGEEMNEYEQFPERYRILSYAHLLCISGFNAHVNRELIAKMAEDGSESARMILARMG